MCDQVFFNSRETSAMLGIPTSTLRWWGRKDWYGYQNTKDSKRLQPVRIGHRLYYHRDAINTFIQEAINNEHAG